jgi:hypothetical protein
MKTLKFITGFTALIASALLTGFFGAIFLMLVTNQNYNWLAISACGLGFFVFLIATINTLFEKAEY